MNYNYFWKCDNIPVCFWKQMQSTRCNFGSPRFHFLSLCVLVRVLYSDCDTALYCGPSVLRKRHHHVGLDSRETGEFSCLSALHGSLLRSLERFLESAL